MKEFDMYIKWIRKQFPDSMNKEQFYKIAHISKAKARWLLQTGLVPCRDTGRKTRRYTIRTDDVITYLKDRAVKPLKYELPRSNGHRPGYENRALFMGLDADGRDRLRAHFGEYLTECADLISVLDTARATGYSQSAVVKWCVTGRVKAFYSSGKYLIPKICLLDYLVSDEAMCVRQKSFKHELMLKEFLDEYGC